VTPNTAAKCRISIYQIGNLKFFIFTFGFVRRRQGDVRVLLDVDYVAGHELGNLARLGIVRKVRFTYAIRSVELSSTYYHTSKHFQRTLDDVRDSWARVVCGDGHTGGKLTESCQ
jgi:hypothetical protein